MDSPISRSCKSSNKFWAFSISILLRATLRGFGEFFKESLLGMPLLVGVPSGVYPGMPRGLSAGVFRGTRWVCPLVFHQGGWFNPPPLYSEGFDTKFGGLFKKGGKFLLLSNKKRGVFYQLWGPPTRGLLVLREHLLLIRVKPLLNRWVGTTPTQVASGILGRPADALMSPNTRVL